MGSKSPLLLKVVLFQKVLAFDIFTAKGENPEMCDIFCELEAETFRYPEIVLM